MKQLTNNRAIGRIALAGIVVVIVAVALVGAAAGSSLGSNSTKSVNAPLTSSTANTSVSSSSIEATSKSSSSSTSSSTTSAVSSSTSSSVSQSFSSSTSSSVSTHQSSGPLSIVVTQVITDSVEYQSSGSTYWIMNLVITDTGSASQDVNPFYFQLTSSANAVYSTAFALGIQNDLQAVTLNSGQHVSGQIAFKVASGESPAKLVFSQPFGITVTVTNIPSSSGVVSYVEGGSANVQGNSSSYIGAFVSVLNSSSYFYTGQVIALKIAINNYGGLNFTVTNITDSDSGLITKGLAQSLPIKIGSSEVDVTLYLEASSTMFNGQLMNVTVTAS